MLQKSQGKEKDLVWWLMDYSWSTVDKGSCTIVFSRADGVLFFSADFGGFEPQTTEKRFLLKDSGVTLCIFPPKRIWNNE